MEQTTNDELDITVDSNGPARPPLVNTTKLANRRLKAIIATIGENDSFIVPTVRLKYNAYMIASRMGKRAVSRKVPSGYRIWITTPVF